MGITSSILVYSITLFAPANNTYVDSVRSYVSGLETDNYKAKLIVLQEAEAQCRAKKNYNALISIVSDQAALAQEYGYNAKAKTLLKAAIRHSEQAKNSEKKGNIFQNLGSLYFAVDELDSAQYFYKQAIKSFIKAKRTTALSFPYLGLAQYYYYEDEPDSSLFYADLARSVSSAEEKEIIERGVVQIKALVKAEQDSKSGKSLNELKLLLKSLQKDSLSGEIVSVAENIALVHSTNSEYDSALVYFHIALENAKLERDAYLVNQISEKVLLFNTLMQKQNRIKQLWIYGITAGIMLLLIALVVVVLFYQGRKKLNQQKLALKEAKIKDLLKNQELSSTRALMAGQDQERRRIAEELHDRLGSMLATIKLNFGQVEDVLQQVQKTNLTYYTQAEKLLDEAAKEVRRISHDLHSGVLQKFGLLAALRQLVESIESAASIEVQLLQTGWEDRLNFDTETNLYRIIQELISNTVKHAGASKITIQLTREGNQSTLIYEDNGKGFNPQSVKLGLGLKNIENRAERIGGKLVVDSTPKHGSTVIIEFNSQ